MELYRQLKPTNTPLKHTHKKKKQGLLNVWMVRCHTDGCGCSEDNKLAQWDRYAKHLDEERGEAKLTK